MPSPGRWLPNLGRGKIGVAIPASGAPQPSAVMAMRRDQLSATCCHRRCADAAEQPVRTRRIKLVAPLCGRWLVSLRRGLCHACQRTRWISISETTGSRSPRYGQRTRPPTARPSRPRGRHPRHEIPSSPDAEVADVVVDAVPARHQGLLVKPRPRSGGNQTSQLDDVRHRFSPRSARIAVGGQG